MQTTDTRLYANKEDATAAILPLYREIVRDYPEVSQLGGKRIKFLLAVTPMKTKGRQILGKCRLFTEKDRHYHDWDAEIVLDKQYWEENPDRRKALLFHELCHLEVDDETGALRSVHHDLEEFYAVWRHFGDWKGELAIANAEQLSLNLDID